MPFPSRKQPKPMERATWLFQLQQITPLGNSDHIDLVPGSEANLNTSLRTITESTPALIVAQEAPSTLVRAMGHDNNLDLCDITNLFATLKHDMSKNHASIIYFGTNPNLSSWL